MLSKRETYFNSYLAVYDGQGVVKENPIHVLVPEAFPNKNFRVSDFKPSGLKGFLQNCLPPFTSTSKFRRDQQILVIMGATGQHFYRLIVHILVTVLVSCLQALSLKLRRVQLLWLDWELFQILCSFIICKVLWLQSWSKSLHPHCQQVILTKLHSSIVINSNDLTI